MKLLHLIPNLNKGGAERLVLDTCIELSKNKENELVLLTFNEGNEYPFLSKQIKHLQIPAQFTPSVFGKSIIEKENLENFIASFKPDIIHCHLFEAAILLTQLKYSCQKVFVHFHDNMHQLRCLKWREILKKRTWTNYYERRLFIRSYKPENTNIIAVSEHTFEYIKKNLPKFKTHLLLNAINVNRFKVNEDSFESSRLVMIGSLVPKKNQRLAIETLKKLTDLGGNFELDLLGVGPLKNELIELAKNLNLESKVHFHGNVDYPEELLKKAYLYLHTAYYEPFGLTLLEAMASGLPVVCLDGGGNAILMKDAINGYIIKDQKPDLFAEKIIQLKHNKEMYNGMKLEALTMAKDFDIAGYACKLIDIYQFKNQ